MAKKKEKKEVITKLKNKYFLKLVRETNLEQVFSIRVSRMSISLTIGVFILLFTAIIVSIVVFSPLRRFIPGYPNSELQQMISNNIRMVDSLEYEIQIRDRYFESIKNIMDGKDPVNYQNPQDTIINYEDIDFSISKEDSQLRAEVEREEMYSLTEPYEESQDNDISKIHFYPPIKGIVTSGFDMSKNHYGTDIVAKANQVVSACLAGTVISSTWSVEYGYIIQIQHEGNLISAYKHNSELLKKTGSHVKAGEPIAIIGNSGENTTGPHLHFELWYNGTALNPEDYIDF